MLKIGHFFPPEQFAPITLFLFCSVVGGMVGKGQDGRLSDGSLFGGGM